jgi:hypothetical protein
VSVKRLLPVLLLVSLAVALTGGILVLVNGVSTPAIVLLVLGFAVGAGIVTRMGGIGKLGGMDEREVSAAIRERAQKNLEMAKGRNHGA